MNAAPSTQTINGTEFPAMTALAGWMLVVAPTGTFALGQLVHVGADEQNRTTMRVSRVVTEGPTDKITVEHC